MGDVSGERLHYHCDMRVTVEGVFKKIHTHTSQSGFENLRILSTLSLCLYSHKYRLIKKLYLVLFTVCVCVCVRFFGFLVTSINVSYQICILNWQLKMELSVFVHIQSSKLLKHFTGTKVTHQKNDQKERGRKN